MCEKSNNVCFTWANYNNQLCNVFLEIWKSQFLLDVTLSAEGKQIKAHRLVLCACSDYFKELLIGFEDDHPIIILSDVSYNDIKSIVDFLYLGELNVDSNNIKSVLDLAKDLKIHGLMDFDGECAQKEVVYDNEFVGADPDSWIVCNDEQIMNQTDSTVDDSINETENVSSLAEVVFDEVGIKDTDIMSFIEVAIPEDGIRDIAPEFTRNVTTNSNKQVLFKIPSENIAAENALEYSNSEICNRVIGNYDNVKYNDVKTEQIQSPTDPDPVFKIINYLPKHNGKTNKVYDSKILQQAFDDIRAGHTLSEVSTAYSIPRSSLYCKIKANKVPLALTRQAKSEETVLRAVQAVVNQGFSLSQAALKHNISKTVLWRKVRKYMGTERLGKRSKNKSTTKFTHQRAEAVKALENGESITSVSQNYHIPKSTLFREKSKLVDLGKLPKSCLRKRGIDDKMRLQEALQACRDGKISQSAAAMMYNVSKTTIWRHLQQDAILTGPDDDETMIQIDYVEDYDMDEDKKVYATYICESQSDDTIKIHLEKHGVDGVRDSYFKV